MSAQSAMSVDAVRAVIAPLVTACGADLEDVTIDKVGRRQKVTVIVDADGGIDLDVIAELSRDISAVLDEQPTLDDAPYVLEVSSPGVDRPLVEPRHWRRAKNRLVAVELTDGSSLTGRVISSDDAKAVLDVAGESTDVPFPTVNRAVVQVEFDRKDD